MAPRTEIWYLIIHGSIRSLPTKGKVILDFVWQSFMDTIHIILQSLRDPSVKRYVRSGDLCYTRSSHIISGFVLASCRTIREIHTTHGYHGRTFLFFWSLLEGWCITTVIPDICWKLLNRSSDSSIKKLPYERLTERTIRGQPSGLSFIMHSSS